MPRLPKPAAKGGLCVILPNRKGEPEEQQKIPGRVYVDKDGVERPWVCDQNARMWLGQQDEDED